MIKTKAQITEMNELRGVADGFTAIIESRQAEYEADGVDYSPVDLLKGTKYEGQVRIKGNVIYAPMDPYAWVYLRRSGNLPAVLIEYKGF